MLYGLLLSMFILVILLANRQNTPDEDNVSNGPWVSALSGLTHLQPYTPLSPASTRPYNFCLLQEKESFSSFICGSLGPDAPFLVLFLLNISSQSQ